ncbi:MAG: adenosylmethionine--8-amino-7-oxononanoate transaminase [Candidatus Omnitrophota bacterium]
MRDYVKLDKKYVWHPFTQMKQWLGEPQIIIKRGKGAYIQDTRGNWYLDGVSSLWVNVHGHRKKYIDGAIKSQINRISHSTLLGLGNRPSIELAEKLIKISPRGLGKVFYSDSGSTAVEIGLKIAFQYWQNIGKKKKTKFASLVNAYHGDTIGSVSVGGIDLFHKIYKPLLFKSIKVNSPYCHRCVYKKTYAEGSNTEERIFGMPKSGQTKNNIRHPQCNFDCIKELRNMLSKHHGEIAALIVEPLVQAAAGIIIWPRGYLKAASKLCKKYNVLLIADEVASGFGRTGKMFACQHENVTPDIMTLAKGITGGYLPLAATLTTNAIYNAFLGDYSKKKTFFHGHTYTGNPLAAAAALANIKLFEKEKTIRRLAPKIEFLKSGLLKFRGLSHVGDIRQIGLMVGIELVKDRKTKKPYSWNDKIGIKVIKQTRKYGVILRPLGNVIVLMPPLSVTIGELKKLLDVTYKSIASATSQGQKDRLN